jgi:hypothetical protein
VTPASSMSWRCRQKSRPTFRWCNRPSSNS